MALIGKNKWFLIPLAAAISFSIGCTTSDDSSSEVVGNWVRVSDFEGVARNESVVTTLGAKAYVGLGFNGTDRLSDFWEYDASKDFWLRRADFPGKARNGAVSFSIDNLVYVGLGYDGINKLNDFWAYNPTTNSWAQVADFGGSARYGAAAFSIGSNGYVVAGYDGNQLKDFWKYSPTTNTWEQLVSPGGSKRVDPVVFVIGKKAYLATGTNNGQNIDDFWEYNSESDAWTQMRKISNYTDETFDDDYSYLPRYRAVAFTIGGKGYITTGITSGYNSTTWEYTPETDTWLQKTDFEGSARETAIGFNIGDRAFVGLGRSSSLRFDDVREFLPADDQVDND